MCRSLGLSSATISKATTGSHFGSTSNEFILDDVNCRGTEDNLGSCYDYITVDNCGSSEGAGVKCLDPYAVQLKGGENDMFWSLLLFWFY